MSNLNPARNPVDAIVHAFLKPVEKDGLEKLSDLLLKQMEAGLAKEDHQGEVKMLITYVHDLPSGKENGDFLVLDLGVCNFRMLKITLTPGEEIVQIIQKFAIDFSTKQSTQEELFDFIAQSIADFVKNNNIKEKLPMGFTLSFPNHQTSLTSGTLFHWTMDFNATGAVGSDVLTLLRDAFERKGVNVDVVALVNDTTGTLMTVGYKDQNCHVGVILGTGTNACYMERLDAVPKFSGDRSKYDKVLISTEWGSFGDKGSLRDYLTEFDLALDKDDAVFNKGQQIFEKMISGKYLGEITRRALKKLICQGVLFGGKCPPCFDNSDKFPIEYLSYIEEGVDLSACRKVLELYCELTDVTDEDCHIVRRVCEAVTSRAARLVGAGIVTLVRKVNRLDKCTVAVDGSLFKRHPQFSEKTKAAIDELAPGNNVIIKLTEDGSGKGTAIAAAVTKRLAELQ